MNTTTTYTRNALEGMEYPYISLLADFSEDAHFINMLWNLENLFVNTYDRESFSVEAYEVEGDLVILADQLQDFDHYHLTKAEDYTTYRMPNGQLLVDYYENHIVNIYEYMDNRDNINKEGYVTRRYSTDLIDPIETRVSFRYEKMYVGARFYDVNDEPIKPTGGSIDIAGVGIAGVEQSIETLQATDVSPVATVDMPFESIKATPSSLSDDVKSWQLIIWQA